MPPTLTANDLRRLAEAADNCENRRAHAVVYDAAEDKFTVVPMDDLRGRTPLMEINNSVIMPSEAKTTWATEATLTVDDRPLSLRTAPTDALPDCGFWGEAAMRKFVIPYYTREMPPEDLAIIWKAIRDPNIIALTHTCPSDYHTIKAPTGAGLTFHLARQAREGDPGFLPPDQGGPGTVFESLTFEQMAAR